MARPEKKKQLEIGRVVETLRGIETPLIDDRPMTIGDLFMRVIPMLTDGQNHMRLWNIGLEMDHAIGRREESFPMTELDYKMLRKAVLSGTHPVWIRANLEKAFEE